MSNTTKITQAYKLARQAQASLNTAIEQLNSEGVTQDDMAVVKALLVDVTDYSNQGIKSIEAAA